MSETTTLAGWMDKMKLSNGDLAAVTGYNRTMIWKIRSGQRRATGDFQLAFEKAYGRPAAHDLWPENFPLETEAAA